jgi:eukaryotic-like serine/threonine-protein kinase
MIGKIIGNYRLIDELGYGNMGVVYRGQHIQEGRDVVVKEISMNHFPTSTRVQLKAHLRRETFILSQLDHPGIANIYESFSRGDNTYLVLEYIEATSLRDLLEREGVPSASQAVYLCKQALAALDYAHNFRYLTESDLRLIGIIHRDIKPSNLLVDANGNLKITDFGIVKMPDRQSMAPPSFRPGTMEYLPPEHLRGIDLDARSDIYSLGVTFYEVLTGKLPVRRPRKEPIADKDKDKDTEYSETGPLPIIELRPEVDPFLASIFMRAIQKAPGDRFQSAAEFLKAIEEFERNNGLSEGVAAVEESFEEGPGVSIIEISETSEIAYSNRSPIISPLSMAPANEVNAPDFRPVLRNARNAMSRNSRKTLWVAAIVFIIFGVPIFAYFLTQQPGAAERGVVEQAEAEGSPAVPSESPSGAKAEPTPASVVPAASAAAPEPTPYLTAVSSGNAEKLRRAREAESRGYFRQSVRRYEEYLRSNPNQADTSLATGELDNLKKFLIFLRDARTASKRQNFEKARLNYVEALKIRPYSRVVREELDQAEKKLSGASR